MNVLELYATLGLQHDAFDKGIASAKTIGLNFANNLAQTFKKAVSTVFDFAKTVTALGVEYNMQMENYRTNFAVMLSSEEAAIEMTDKLKTMAAKTPFAMTDLADATQTLLSYNIASDNVVADLQILGDIALGDANKLSTLTSVFGQISMAGKLLTQDYKQLINVGFNPLTYIAKRTGETMEELQDRMSKGKITLKEVEQAFKDSTSEGGQYYGGMEEASKTLSGQWSTLEDNWSEFWGNVMLPVNDQLAGTVVPTLIEKLGELSDALFGTSQQIQADPIFGEGENPFENLQNWLENLRKVWSDGNASNDNAGTEIAAFEEQTLLIEAALRNRLNAGNLDPEEEENIRANLNRIDEIKARISEILTGNAGKNVSEGTWNELDTLTKELQELTGVLGDGTETEKALSPWERFVTNLGSLSVDIINSLSQMVIDWVNGGGVDTVFTSINGFFEYITGEGFKTDIETFKTTLDEIITKCADIINKIWKIMHPFDDEDIELENGDIEHVTYTPDGHQIRVKEMSEENMHSMWSQGVAAKADQRQYWDEQHIPDEDKQTQTLSTVVHVYLNGEDITANAKFTTQLSNAIDNQLARREAGRGETAGVGGGRNR